MKKHWAAILFFSFSLCVLTYLLTKVYDTKIAEAMQPIIVYETNPQITIVNSSKVKPLKRKVKRLQYWGDSLSAENIRKDGIIGDEKQFPKIIFTDPIKYQLNIK